jgi:hypothetical protein
MLYLGRIYPRAIRFDDLLSESAQLLGRAWESSEAHSEEAQSLAALIIKTHGAGLTEFHLHEPTFALTPGERPLASPLARLQAQQGSMVATLLYQTVKFEDQLGQKLLLLLDGTRDRTALLTDFGQIIGQSTSEVDDAKVNSKTLPPLSLDQLEEKLAELARLGLLLA